MQHTMSASDLIREITRLMDEYGDLPVYRTGGEPGSERPIGPVEVYDVTGNDPTADSPAVQIHIH